jgi:hypothetical protein
MMRARWSVTAAAALVAIAAGCDKQAGSKAAAGSGSALPAPVAPVAPDALDKALADKHIEPAAVLRRAITPGAAWALIATRDRSRELRAYDLLRVRAADTAMLHLAPPAGKSQLDDTTVSLEARDLDGDGNSDALLVVAWKREVKVSDPCQGCFRTQDEEGSQLYVISGDRSELAIAFTHLVAYTSFSESYPEGNDTASADPDDVAYDWTIAGSPPTLRLTRTKDKMATRHRLKGALDPATDALLSAGAGKDIPLVLK